MAALNKSNSILNQVKNIIFKQEKLSKNNAEKKNNNLKADRFTKSKLPEKVTYSREDFAAKNAVKRPIKINNSNNTFFINHKNRNQTLKIEPGEYNLTEIQAAIQQQANKKFGIGKITLKMTASGRDRFIYADSKNEK